jgi:HEAT repeat protein
LQIPSNKSKFFWRESLKRVRIVRYIDESGKDYHSLAVRGFQILGTNALNASEDLLTLLNNGYPPDSIIQSIAYLGESTYPIIEKLLEHKDPNIRRNALTVLFMYPCRKPEVEDAVRRAIRDPDYTVRNMADVVREHLGIQTESFKNAKPLRPEI